MARDPLLMLRVVRRRSIEAARHALGACLVAEAEAASRIKALNDGTLRDRAVHPKLEDGHLFQEMFTRRVLATQAARMVAEAEFAAAQAGSAEARALVVAARTAAEAVETLIAERTAQEEAVATKAGQHALDDMTRVRFDFNYRRDSGGTR